MNNPAILDIALSFVLHKHSKDEFGRKNNKAQAIHELSNNELAALLNELVAQQDNCPHTVSGWKEWLTEEIK
jgi:hypothetical protein